MSKKDKILSLYFEEHKRQEVIASILQVSQSYVSQVIKSDSRLAEEKEYRNNLSRQKKKDYNKEYWTHYQRKKSNDMEEYRSLQAKLDNDSKELSYRKQEMSDYDYVSWNSSAYHTNSKGNRVLNKGLNVGADVPKVVNMNKKVQTQKYKQFCYSR